MLCFLEILQHEWCSPFHPGSAVVFLAVTQLPLSVCPQLFGRTVKASIAVDNGRATEFIRRRNYADKSRCYECGVGCRG